MIHNLADPENAHRAWVTECQKKAAFWLWQLRQGLITRQHVNNHLAGINEEASREETRKWLNHYHQQTKG